MSVVGIIVVCGASCVRTAPEPRISYLVSSDGSQYSPSATFSVSSSHDGARLQIEIDTGTLVVPGNYAAPAPLAMTSLYLTAYVAGANVRPMALALPDTGRFPDRRGWRAVTGSDSVLIADQLRYGEHRSVGRVHLSLPLPAHGDGPQWLVFRISGKVVDHRMAFDESIGLRVGKPGGSTRVYVCSDRDLKGNLDAARSNALKQSYGLLC